MYYLNILFDLNILDILLLVFEMPVKSHLLLYKKAWEDSCPPLPLFSSAPLCTFTYILINNFHWKYCIVFPSAPIASESPIPDTYVTESTSSQEVIR